MADHIAVLAAPGRLVADGSPVALKRDLGEGYSAQVSFKSSAEEKDPINPRGDLLQRIRSIAPQTYFTTPSPHQVAYHLKTRDAVVVGKVLQLLDNEKATYNISSYDVLGTTIEDIFLDLMSKNSGSEDSDRASRETLTPTPTEKPEPVLAPAVMELSSGRAMAPHKQALTIFYKRYLIARRSWLTPILTILVAVAGACIPLVFIRGRSQSCVRKFGNSSLSVPLYLPASPIVPFTFGPSSRVLTSPPGIISTLGSSVSLFRITNVTDNDAFIDTIKQNYRNLSLGGVSLDLNTGASLVAWEASPPGITGPSMLNLASNLLYNNALNTSGNAGSTPTIIRANYSAFPPVGAGTLVSLKWMVFFGAVMVCVINSLLLII